MNYLGLDYGLSHIGIAYSEGVLSEPLTEIPNTSFASIVRDLQKIVREKAIDCIVLGISENLMGEKTKEFGLDLSRELDIEVKFVDETLSSHTARQYLIEGGAGRKKRQTSEHMVAAAAILQFFLDEMPEN